MPFSVEEFHDLVRILEEQPEWRRELRRFVLTDELLSLPEQVASLRATTEQRFQELAEKISKLTDQVSELTESQKRIEGQFSELADSVRILANDVGALKGEALENRYRTKGLSYFSRLVRRPHVLSGEELSTLVEDAVDKGVLSDDQAGDIYAADVIARGRRKEDGIEVYLVVEVSWGVGPADVDRAARRASLLASIGVTAIPVVAGTWVTPDAAWLAHRSKTWQLTDGRAIPPEPNSVSSS